MARRWALCSFLIGVCAILGVALQLTAKKREGLSGPPAQSRKETVDPSRQLANAPDKSSEILFGSTEIDLGEVVEKQPRNFNLDISNPTSEPVSITEVSVSCSCLKILDWPRILVAGEQKPIRMSYNPSGQSGRTSVFVLVRSKSLKNGERATRVAVHAHVNARFLPDAPTRLSRVDPGQKFNVVSRMRLFVGDYKAISIQADDESSALVKHLTWMQEKDLITMNLDCVAPDIFGPFAVKVAIKDNSTNVINDTVVIAVGEARSAYVDKNTISLGIIKTSHLMEASDTITVRYSGPFQVEEPIVTGPFRAYIKSTAPDAVQIQVKSSYDTSGDIPVGRCQGYLTLKTNIKDMQMVKLPISGFILRD
jgi:hypothetical protein